MEDVVKKLQEAARLGGSELLKYFGKAKVLKTKSVSADFVTEADIASNKVIVGYIENALPEYNILSEEDPYKDKGSRYTIIIDPLDGTNNFAMGLPTFTVSIAVRTEGRYIIGVVYNPVLDHMYYAWEKGGAYKNGQKLKVNSVDEITKSSISFTVSYGAPLEFLGQKYNHLMVDKKIQRLLTNWSVALDFCLLAEGNIEGLINYGSQEYDYAAGFVIAQEAGAKHTYFENKLNVEIPQSALTITSNGTAIHKHLEDIVK